METNVHYTIVGVFVLSLLVAIILGIIWLSSGFNFEQFTTYQINMTESVSGVTTDSPVEFNGVNVGNVRAIHIDRADPHLVRMLVDIRKSIPITEGTRATLNSRGVTGFTYVALIDNGENLTHLKALPGQKYPIILSAPSLFNRLDTALSELTKNFDKVSSAVECLLNNQNQQAFSNILQNMEHVTATLSKNDKKIDSLLENAAKASSQMEPFLKSGSSAMRTLQSQTLPETYQLLANLDKVARTLVQVSKELKQNPSMLVRGKANPPLGPGESP
jgi:phospholipid/cholesterol/gamma-HCH transport system substrate-binding protein